MGKKCFLFSFLIILTSCLNKSDNAFISFFDLIDKEIKAEEREVFDKCNAEISCLLSCLNNSSIDASLILKFDSLPNEINNLLDSLDIDKYRGFTVLVAYCQSRIEGKGMFDFSSINNEINCYLEEEQDIINRTYQKMDSNLREKAQNNFIRYDINDTICLSFPLKININKEYEIVYRVPKNDDKLVTIKGIIKDMKSKRYNDKEDRFLLTINLIDFSHSPLNYSSKHLSKGDNFVLDIFNYGRDFDDCIDKK